MTDAPHVLRARAFERIAEGYGLLAAAERATGTREVYSTKRGHGPPEFLDRHREWTRLAPTIAGAYKPDPASRWWCVRRADYEAHIAQHARPASAPAANDAPWTPAVALAAVARRAR